MSTLGIDDCTLNRGIRVGYKCYLKTEENAPSFSDAKAMCKGWGGNLFTPVNNDDLIFMNELVDTDVVWTSGTDLEEEGALVWGNGLFVFFFVEFVHSIKLLIKAVFNKSIFFLMICFTGNFMVKHQNS